MPGLSKEYSEAVFNAERVSSNWTSLILGLVYGELRIYIMFGAYRIYCLKVISNDSLIYAWSLVRTVQMPCLLLQDQSVGQLDQL